MTAQSDLELRERLLKDASSVAEEIKKDSAVLAVILSGPLALDVASETGKLYFAVVTSRDDGIIEHHFLDEGIGEVKRPVEIGRFPLAVARFLITHGYRDMVTYKSLEAFRCGRVLWEKDGVGTEITEGAASHIPEKRFIGESLHGAVSALDDAVALLANGDFVNAVLVAREAVVKAVGMAVAARMREGDISLLEAARECLPPEQFGLFREIMGIESVDPDAASENARRAREFAEHTLREIGVDPQRVLGPREKGQSA